MRVKNKTNQVQHLITLNGSITVGPGMETEIDEKNLYDFELLRMKKFFKVSGKKTIASSTGSGSTKRKNTKKSKKEDVKSKSK
jgi:radical SAM superfamily enzyme YgiQ (UPF0313 family)